MRTQSHRKLDYASSPIKSIWHGMQCREQYQQPPSSNVNTGTAEIMDRSSEPPGVHWSRDVAGSAPESRRQEEWTYKPCPPADLAESKRRCCMRCRDPRIYTRADFSLPSSAPLLSRYVVSCEWPGFRGCCAELPSRTASRRRHRHWGRDRDIIRVGAPKTPRGHVLGHSSRYGAWRRRTRMVRTTRRPSDNTSHLSGHSGLCWLKIYEVQAWPVSLVFVQRDLQRDGEAAIMIWSGACYGRRSPRIAPR